MLIPMTKNRKPSKRKAKINFWKEKTKCRFKGTQKQRNKQSVNMQ